MKKTPSYIDKEAAALRGYHRVTDTTTGARYLKTPIGWQYWSDLHQDYVNGLSDEKAIELDTAFKDL